MRSLQDEGFDLRDRIRGGGRRSRTRSRSYSPPPPPSHPSRMKSQSKRKTEEVMERHLKKSGSSRRPRSRSRRRSGDSSSSSMEWTAERHSSCWPSKRDSGIDQSELSIYIIDQSELSINIIDSGESSRTLTTTRTTGRRNTSQDLASLRSLSRRRRGGSLPSTKTLLTLTPPALRISSARLERRASQGSITSPTEAIRARAVLQDLQPCHHPRLQGRCHQNIH